MFNLIQFRACYVNANPIPLKFNRIALQQQAAVQSQSAEEALFIQLEIEDISSNIKKPISRTFSSYIAPSTALPLPPPVTRRAPMFKSLTLKCTVEGPFISCMSKSGA